MSSYLIQYEGHNPDDPSQVWSASDFSLEEDVEKAIQDVFTKVAREHPELTKCTITQVQQLPEGEPILIPFKTYHLDAYR